MRRRRDTSRGRGHRQAPGPLSIAGSLVALGLCARPDVARAEGGAPDARAGWPCAGCVVQSADGAAPGARPLLVALHGDAQQAGAMVEAWGPACRAAGVVLLAPQCPADLGCANASWWVWRTTARHDPGWLGAQIEAVGREHPIDERRVLLAGYSGGASYLGWWVPENAARVAAASFVSGGYPNAPACPACKVPVRFTIGAGDPMLDPYVWPLRRWWEGCGGHEIAWEILPGVSHEAMPKLLGAGKAADLVAWMMDRPARCLPPSAPAEPARAAPVSPPGSSADARAAGASASGPVAPRRTGGCGCRVSGGSDSRAGALLAAIAAIVRSLRPARRRAGAGAGPRPARAGKS